MRNERFSNKLMFDQAKKDRIENKVMKRSEKHVKSQQNLEEQELKRREFVQLTKERREN